MPLNSLAALLTGAALLVAHPASGMEPKAAADALAAALAKGSDSKVTYEAAEAEGADVLIRGLSVSRGPEHETVTFAESRIEAPTEGSNGAFESPRMTFTSGKVTGPSVGTIPQVVVTGATVLDPAQIKGDGLGASILFQTAEATDLKGGRAATPDEISIKRVFVETWNVVDNVAQDSRGVVEDITVSPAAFAGSAVKPETLGYDAVVFDVKWDGSHNVADRTVNLRNMTISMEGAGDLSMALTIGNLPNPRVLNDDEAAAEATKVEVHNFSLRYEDDSLAGRVLEYLAGQQGISRQEYAQQMSAALPFLLAMLNNPAFQAEIATALGTFLQDPQSLNVVIAPETPVSAEELIGIAGSAPQTLPDRLKASIKANQPE